MESIRLRFEIRTFDEDKAVPLDVIVVVRALPGERARRGLIVRIGHTLILIFVSVLIH